MTIEAELQTLVNNFVADVTKLARRAAMDTVASLLANVDPSEDAPRPRASRAAASSASPSSSGGSSRRPRGSKRAAGDLASLQQRIGEHVRQHPGQKVTDLNAALATTTAELRLPLAKLIAAGELRTTGQKRATQYFPA